MLKVDANQQTNKQTNRQGKTICPPLHGLSLHVITQIFPVMCRQAVQEQGVFYQAPLGTLCVLGPVPGRQEPGAGPRHSGFPHSVLTLSGSVGGSCR
ncbi:hypothetical protein DPMN_188008 [Dreissena polymorpha]|uniref:Uncharacterized protein n=1 Tax=Dreissena polymorpha TaxID=45954 RepID=A0A9D4IAY6_DREPO|nr:hypothetical protein DPMN_188008 [Dreissena polymorpha]